jgi:hypothetical protein
VKSTGENEESFPAFDDLFDEDAAQEEENETPAVEEKVEVIVFIAQNSEEWKDAMDKFPSAKMYQERLLDFVQFATDAPDSFSLENCLCIYFKENSRKVNEDGLLKLILSDTVDAKLARLFLIQARDPAFEGHWSAHIQKTALRLIKLRLMDEMYRTLVPENEIAIWPRRLTAPPGEPLEFSMIAIAEIIVKIYAPETAPHVKSIDQRCREAPFEYNMKDQDTEEKFIILYLQLIENHFLGETLSEEDDDRLDKLFCKKLPRNTGMAKLYVASTKARLDGGLDTVEKAVLRVKKLLAVVRQAIRFASSYGPEEYVFRTEN